MARLIWKLRKTQVFINRISEKFFILITPKMSKKSYSRVKTHKYAVNAIKGKIQSKTVEIRARSKQ